MEDNSSRVVVLVDMDCFYCQVEARDDPSLIGVPAAVVQYNDWKGGALIAVNYEARANGVTRQMRGDEARSKCPEIRLVKVPENREKADLTKYRDAGTEVIRVLSNFKGAVVERASVDEAYLDISDLVIVDKKDGVLRVEDIPNTFVVGVEDVGSWMKKAEADRDLIVGARIVEEMRAAVFEKTGFRCSAGISRNKILAKFACGINKPNKQTILPRESVPELFRSTKIHKLRGLGGKTGETVIRLLGIETVGELANFSKDDLRKYFDNDDKTSSWLYDLAHGIDDEPVKSRGLPKSIGCSKNFPKMLKTRKEIELWTLRLSEEVCERLKRDREANRRTARTLNVGVTTSEDRHSSRSGSLESYEVRKMAEQVLGLISKINPEVKITSLSVSASNFQEGDSKNIRALFEAQNEGFNVAEMIPDLQNYDPSILEFLPPNVKSKVLERVQYLKSSDNNSEKTESFFAAKKKRKEESFVPNLDPSILQVQERKVEAERYLMSPEESSAKCCSNQDLEKCPKCSELISPFDMPEHLDFHLAKELQKEIRKEDFLEIQKKKNRPSSHKNNGDRKQKDILSFFTKTT